MSNGQIVKWFEQFEQFEQAKRASTTCEIVKLITDSICRAKQSLRSGSNEVPVWDALLQRMPMTAMIRNLGKMTSIGLVKLVSAPKKLILRKLKPETALKHSRIHPLAVVVALARRSSM